MQPSIVLHTPVGKPVIVFYCWDESKISKVIVPNQPLEINWTMPHMLPKSPLLSCCWSH